MFLVSLPCWNDRRVTVHVCGALSWLHDGRKHQYSLPAGVTFSYFIFKMSYSFHVRQGICSSNSLVWAVPNLNLPGLLHVGLADFKNLWCIQHSRCLPTYLTFQKLYSVLNTGRLVNVQVSINTKLQIQAQFVFLTQYFRPGIQLSWLTFL